MKQVMAVLAAFAVSTLGLAQNSPASSGQAPTANSQQGSNFDLSGGYVRNYPKNTSLPYYNIVVDGMTLDTYGNAPSFSHLSTSGFADVSKYTYSASLTQGYTSFGGQLAQAAKTIKLPKDLPVLKDFNLVFGYDTQQNSINATAYVFEVEQARPFTFGFLSRGLADINGFAVFGFADEKLSQTTGKTGSAAPGTSSSTDQLGPTLRGMIGRQFIFGDTHTDSPTAKALVKYANDFKTLSSMSEAQTYFHANHSWKKYTDVAGHSDEGPALEALMSAFVAAKVKAKTEAITQGQWDFFWNDLMSHPGVQFNTDPTLVIWADGNARYALGQVQGNRLREIFSLNAKMYFKPGNNDMPYLQAQYLNGYQEATPTARSNVFQVLLGWSF
jgi:hypothetical protein